MIENIARFTSSWRLDEVPEDVRQRARLQTASVFAAIFAAAQQPASRRLRAWAEKQAAGDASVLGTKLRRARSVALLANASASCTLDFDDYQLIGHTGHSAVLVPLLWGEVLESDWHAYEAAQIVAAEVAGRLGLACFIGPQNGQHLPFVHHTGAALATARMLQLDDRRTAHALALALAQPEAALWPAFLGPIDGKVLTAATAAVHGMTSAELAAEGMTGALDLLDHPKGFFARFAFLPAPRAFDNLGGPAWSLSTLHVKEHPACAYFQTAIDAAEALSTAIRSRLGRPPVAGDLNGVNVETTLLGAAVDAHGQPSEGGAIHANDVNFSLALTVALTLARGRLGPAELNSDALAAQSGELRQIASKIRVRHDWQLSRQVLARIGEALGVRKLLAAATPREIVRAVADARRIFPRAPLDPRPTAAALMDGLRLLANPIADSPEPMAKPLTGVTLPLATRISVRLSGGEELFEERSSPRGAPDRPFAEAQELCRKKLVDGAGAVLGDARAGELADRLLRPREGQTIREVLELLEA